MFGIMNAVFRTATRSEMPDHGSDHWSDRRDWPHRAAIERSEALREEGAYRAPSDPGRP